MLCAHVLRTRLLHFGYIVILLFDETTMSVQRNPFRQMVDLLESIGEISLPVHTEQLNRSHGGMLYFARIEAGTAHSNLICLATYSLLPVTYCGLVGSIFLYSRPSVCTLPEDAHGVKTVHTVSVISWKVLHDSRCAA